MIKRYLPYVTIGALLLSAFGCGTKHAETENAGGGLKLAADTSTEPFSVQGKYGGEYIVAAISDPKTFNLWVSAETSSSQILGPLYEALTQRNSYTLKYEARLADLPKISADGLTYTYTLKPGLKWSDGVPITADDVIFTFDVLYDPAIQTLSREMLLVDVKQPDGTIKRGPFQYKKIDDHTVQFTLPESYAPAQEMFGQAIMPKHALEAAYKSGKFNSFWAVNTPPSQLLSSGGWVLSEYVPGQRAVYKHNPNFWRKSVNNTSLPFIDNYTYLIVPNLNATTLKFRSKETDSLTVQAPDYPDIKKGEDAGGYKVLSAGSGWGFNYLTFNMNPTSKIDKNLVALFSDVRFRQAISYATNRQRMCDDIFQGLAQPAYSPVSPANKIFYDTNVRHYDYDLTKAKALLTEVGLTDSNHNGFLEYHGKEVKFNILTNTENDLRKSMATIMTDDMKKIGLNVTFTPINFNDLIRRVTGPPYDWEAVVLGFTGGPEPSNGSNIWRSSGISHQWYPNQKKPATPWEAKIDELWQQGRHETDLEKRKLIYNQWQEIVAEQQPFIFTVVVDANYAMRNHYGNVKPSALGGVDWNLEELYDTNATRVTP